MDYFSVLLIAGGDQINYAVVDEIASLLALRLAIAGLRAGLASGNPPVPLGGTKLRTIFAQVLLFCQRLVSLRLLILWRTRGTRTRAEAQGDPSNQQPPNRPLQGLFQ